MLIECMLRREGPIVVPHGNESYEFKQDALGRRVCEVWNKSHIECFLARSEAYREAASELAWSEEQERLRQRYAWRVRWNQRYLAFRKRQAERRDWITFEEAADWFARDGNLADKGRKREAHRELLSAAHTAAFNKAGACRVHLLKSVFPAGIEGGTDPVGRRMGWEDFQLIERHRETGRWDAACDYLADCWIRRDVLLEWCVATGRRPRPDWRPDWQAVAGNEPSTPPKPKRRGRPKGTSLDALDAPLVRKMRQLIDDRKAATPTAAARLIVSREPAVVPGDGTPESKMTRLVRRYRRGE